MLSVFYHPNHHTNTSYFVPTITSIGRAGASTPSRATGAIFLYNNISIVALRENVKPAHCKFKGHQFSTIHLTVRRLSICDTTSSTDNRCPSSLQRCQRLLNGTPCGYLHRPAMCVSLPMNASCCAFVLPSTHDYAYRACDISSTASRIAPAHPKMLSIALVTIHVQCRYTCNYTFKCN